MHDISNERFKKHVKSNTKRKLKAKKAETERRDKL
jgi:hypothetical protein